MAGKDGPFTSDKTNRKDVPSGWTVGQVEKKAIADRERAGPWELRFGDVTLSERTVLPESGIGAKSQLDLIPQIWDIASLEDKQPIFKVTFENSEFEEEYGVSKLDVFLQYVRGQDIDYNHATFFSGASNGGRKMIEFRMLAASAREDDFVRFDYFQMPSMAEQLGLLSEVLSPRQMDMVYLDELRKLLGIRDELYFPFFDAQLNDVSLLFHQPLKVFYPRGRCMLAEGTLITFEEVVFGSEEVPDVRKMHTSHFFDAGLTIRSMADLRRWQKWQSIEVQEMFKAQSMTIFLQKDGNQPKPLEASAKMTLGEVRKLAHLRSGRFIVDGQEYEEREDCKSLADLRISARSTLIFISWIDVTVQIDALYHYPAQKEKDEKQPLEKHIYDIYSSLWIGGRDYGCRQIIVELKLRP